MWQSLTHCSGAGKPPSSRIPVSGNNINFGCTMGQMFVFMGGVFWLGFMLAFELGVLDGASL